MLLTSRPQVRQKPNPVDIQTASYELHLGAQLQLLQERISNLSDVMNVNEDRVRALVMEKPVLLTKSTDSVREAIKVAKLKT